MAVKIMELLCMRLVSTNLTFCSTSDLVNSGGCQPSKHFREISKTGRAKLSYMHAVFYNTAKTNYNHIIFRYNHIFFGPLFNTIMVGIPRYHVAYPYDNLPYYFWYENS
jgi:hypothetical protein